MAAVRAADPSTTCSVAAIEEPGALRAYKSDVRWRIHQGDPESYREAAKSINLSNAEVVSTNSVSTGCGMVRASSMATGLFRRTTIT